LETVRGDARSAIWGGVTLGLVVGLILGFYVGTYWTTVLYAVLIGAAAGVAANALAGLAWLGSRRQRRLHEGYEAVPLTPKVQLEYTEELPRENSPADFETTPNAAAGCVGAVGALEEHEWWRVGYDSLGSFYAAHEDQHPDIRVYATVLADVPTISSMEPPDGEVIAREIALRRLQQSG
jgi:hypothetical protein